MPGMGNETGRPAWQDWPEEPWEEKPIRGSGFTARRRALACVNALAGRRNPAAVGEVLDAAGPAVEAFCDALTDTEIMTEWPEIDRFRLALAALDREPEE